MHSKWNYPQNGWITDGACMGNPWLSSYGFCLREKHGNIIYADANMIGIRSIMKAEIIGILSEMRNCKRLNLERIVIKTDSLCLIRF